MLIRSQNKEVLVAFEFLPDIEVSGGVISARRDMGWCCLLGEYSTKAKAIKVLDMIQEAYCKFMSVKNDDAWNGYLLSSAALSACPKNTVIADMVIENILHRKSYRKISKERYIQMNPKDFYGYRRKTVAVLYERMRLLGVWEEK